MTISTAGIKKVAFITAANMVFGLVSCKQTPKEPAVMRVYVSYAGADSAAIKLKVLDPLQKEISNISNIHKISAIAQNGYGNIIVEFNMNKNIDSATVDIQNRLLLMNVQLPKEAKVYSFSVNNEDKKNKNNQ